MAKSRTIQVTSNLELCLKELKKIIETLPPGDQKKKAEAILAFMSKAFDGEPQTMKGPFCPKLDVVPS